MPQNTYTVEEVLRQLDECAEKYTFPMLDNGYVYPLDVRLHAFADLRRWALVIEAAGYNYRGCGHNGAADVLYCYGNCLKRAPGTAIEDFLPLTEDGPEGPTFDPEYGQYVRPEARSILLRGTSIPVSTDPGFYAAGGIELEEPPRVHVFELLRGLLPEHRERFFATEEELRQRVPADLPRLLRLEEWRHPDLVNGELPSQCPTFGMIAEVLVFGDPSRYQPRDPPNTHWSHWPDGGTL